MLPRSYQGPVFQCRQKEGESVEIYELLLNRKESEPQEVAQVEPSTRDQFIKGFRPGKVPRKMECLIRQRPELSVSEVCTEAQALEKEQNRKDEAQAARVVAPSPTDTPGLNRWKEEVKAKLKQEMHDQLSIISKTLIEEVHEGSPQEV